MTTKVIYLPLDERPCNYLYPQQLAAMTDLTMVAPPPELLGRKKERADLEGVGVWLKEQCRDADVLIVSLDMLVHGGIVPSRLHHETVESCQRRLDLLRTLKSMNPRLAIYGFNLITRVPAYSSSEEEPEYYDAVGREIYELGWLTDKSGSVGLTEEEQLRLNEVLDAIPGQVLEDYRTRRSVNSAVNGMALELVEAGVVDYLVIPLDDNSQYGFSAMEQRALTVRAELAGLSDRVAIYPGADEIGCTLFARVFCAAKGFTPALFVRYSSTKGPLCIPKYEDRSLNESIKAHLTSAGAVIADTSAEADAILMVHSPAVGQSEMAETGTALPDRHRSYFSEINTREFVQAMKYYLDAGRLVMLADVALCNGADHLLMKLIHQRGLLGRLEGYAAWNTSGNSLGTVIAHAVIESYYRRLPAESDDERRLGSRRFYISRLIEDWGYQALVRQKVCEESLPGLGASYFALSHAIEEVCARIEAELDRFAEEYLSGQVADRLKVQSVSLPWRRMFEVAFAIETGGVH
ncbi:DUF4127 family protein [Paenibacillus faecis]|uniref:DUF4127 family protein n=1 Tax=Paenibacillus faecis TaxID=862114 RepID=A0A5D0CLU2_9BACL|nr:DUF4127 family protein [Paenibacillus faecis]TYA10989.1 DUF4127 family protein [Paenibacillus faecis]